MVLVALRAVGDAVFLSGAVRTPVLNGCEERRLSVLGGSCVQPQQKTAHPNTQLDSQSGEMKPFCVFDRTISSDFTQQDTIKQSVKWLKPKPTFRSHQHVLSLLLKD